MNLLIDKLRYEFNKTSKEAIERNKALENEKMIVSKHYSELKRKMIQFRESEVRRLTELTNNSRNCVNKLSD